MHLTIIICTKDRPFEIERVLNSIKDQTRKPDCVVIADGSDNAIKNIVDSFSFCEIKYLTVRPPSLTRQRNFAIKEIPQTTDWIGFLDDDVLIDKDCFEEIEKATLIKSEKKLGALAWVVQNGTVSLQNADQRSLFKEFLLLDKLPGGTFTYAGSPTIFRRSINDQKVKWLSGGNCFYKKEVLDKHSFDEWYAGTGYLEDVDFSYRVSREYDMYMCANAKGNHYDHPVRKEKMFAFGAWQITSWWYFINKAKDFNKFLVLWGMVGAFCSNLGIGILRPKNYRFLKAMGNIKGLILILLGKALIKKEFRK